MIVPEFSTDLDGTTPDPRQLTGGQFTRRLSDKILAAFSHAYSTGRIEIANQLLDVLEACAEEEGPDRSAKTLEIAKAWMLFVQARNRYNTLKMDENSDPDDDAAALEEMKATHRDWSAL